MAEENDIGLPEDLDPESESNSTPEESAGADVPPMSEEGDAGGIEAEGGVSPDEIGQPVETAVAEEASEGEAPADTGDDKLDEFKVVNDDDASEDDAEAAMLAMLEDLPDEDTGAAPEDIDFGTASASRAEFQQLTEPVSQSDAQNIDLLLDVNLPVSIELGRTRMSIEEILALGPGSVVELNKLAGEPVDLLVNYKVVAKGEVVVIDENFGVRITQLLTPEERLKALGEQ